MTLCRIRRSVNGDTTEGLVLLPLPSHFVVLPLALAFVRVQSNFEGVDGLDFKRLHDVDVGVNVPEA